MEEDVKTFYNRQYLRHGNREIVCPHAMHDMAKARRRVQGVLRGFAVDVPPQAQVLDVGSGLGYYTKAIADATLADVVGLDFSEAAIEAGHSTFPECRFVCGAWPQDIPASPAFDVIWMVNFSLMNTFDIGHIEEHLVDAAMRRLKPGGSLVIGWNTDFSGRTVGGYSHWSLSMLQNMRERCGLSAPLVTEAGGPLASRLLIRVARATRRSIPIFMIRRKAR